jgi:hypothetical protein
MAGEGLSNNNIGVTLVDPLLVYAGSVYSCQPKNMKQQQKLLLCCWIHQWRM